MEIVKYKSLGGSYIDIEGGAIKFTQIIDDMIWENKDGNHQKIITQSPCRINEKESKKRIKLYIHILI